MRCFENTDAIFNEPFCISEVSKDLRGELNRLDLARRDCSHPPCETLRVLQRLKVAVASHKPCDSPLAGAFDGTLVFEPLATAFKEHGEQRGFHAGDFTWYGNGVVAKGQLTGITNAGTHRQPVFQDCQPCDARGFMEGAFCGQVVETKVPELEKCHIQGTYRFSFDPSTEAIDTATRGTLEGVLICPCH